MDLPNAITGDGAVITGASSGIGKATAARFIRDGVDVAICSRKQENVDATAEDLNQEEGTGRVVPIECDVTDRDAVDSLIDIAVEKFNGIDVLVNNAGAGFVAPFEEISPNGWDVIVDINLNGTYNCTQAAADALAGGGTVINLASIAGQNGLAQEVHYAAAKAGVINFTRTLAFEWATKNVRVNCIAPGFIATAAFEDHWEVSGDGINRTQAGRRIGTVEEVADVVHFLATPAASFINGETITVEGVPRVEQSADIPPVEDAGP